MLALMDDVMIEAPGHPHTLLVTTVSFSCCVPFVVEAGAELSLVAVDMSV
jgi:hypothetical protein